MRGRHTDSMADSSLFIALHLSVSHCAALCATAAAADELMTSRLSDLAVRSALASFHSSKTRDHDNISIDRRRSVGINSD